MEGLGHNNPPNDVELLREHLAYTNEELINRQKELIGSLDRVPEICDDEETSQKITDTVKMIANCKKGLEAKRVGAKEPYLTLERSVDSFFKPLTEALDKGKIKLERTLGSYLQRKAETERQARIAEANRLRAEQEKRDEEARAAEVAKMPELAQEKMQEAVAAETHAVKAEKSAEARPAKLAVTHGDYGSRSSLRSTKVATITNRFDLNLTALLPHFSEQHLQIALNSWMKANWVDDKNPPTLPGAAFTIETTAQVR